MRQRANCIPDWNVDDRVRRIVETTSFKCFLSFEDELRQFRSVISHVVNCFDENSFSFNFGPPSNRSTLIYGLEDVVYILGLPIDGNPVTGCELGDNTIVYQNMLGSVPDAKYIDGRRLKLCWLKNNFQTVPEAIDDHELWYFVRAYILYILGCVFVDSSAPTVSPMYLQLLVDKETINGYAWGAAMLTYLLHSLKHFKVKKEMKTIKGFIFPLFVSIIFFPL